MQAEMIDLLSGKGKFPTEQALVLAEAIDRDARQASSFRMGKDSADGEAVLG